MRDFFQKNGILSKHLSDFSERESQVLMAERVSSAIKNKSFLVIEAPTGVGKTFAYLIPIFKERKKAIISTATIVLQHQLFEKDIPLVQDIFKRDVKVENLKGRQNYLCLLRFFSEKSRPQSRPEKKLYEIISEWIKYTDTGDFAEIEGLSTSSASVRKINADRNFCTGKDCPHYKECFFYRARKRCEQADIILVNHHLFVSDLALKSSDFGNILPPVDVVIVDEAHKFENIASIQFGETYSLRMLAIFFNQLPSELRLKFVKNFDYLLEKESLSIPEDVLTSKITKNQHPYFNVLKETMESVNKDLAIYDKKDFELKFNLMKRANRFIKFVDLIWSSDYVSFFQKDDKSVIFYNIPLDISEKLSFLFRAYYPCTVFTSATLSVNESLGFFKKSIGLIDAEDCILPSVFDYKKSATLYIPEEIPDVNSPDFVKDSVSHIKPVLEKLKGKAFILCTSLKNVSLFAKHLKEQTGLNILVQGEESNSFLIERFKEEDNSVLIGSFSFWEGVDIKGEDLSCVIIDRLPFTPPDDPLFSERAKRIKNSFKEYSIPLAILQLKQGMGRLIRDERDKGVFIILDKRIKKKWYGRYFLKSIYNARMVEGIEALMDYIDKMIING